MNARSLFSLGRSVVLGTWLLTACTTAFFAQEYPSRGIRIVVPYSAGGSSDVVARVVGAELERKWGQAVTVENRPGAAGNIGSTEVARSTPDGYTLLMQNDTMLTNLAVHGKLPYHHENDLTPIMLLGMGPLALVVHPSINVTNMAELQAARDQVNGLSYGSCGIGSPSHFVMELIMDKTALSFTQVGYRGCSPAVKDVLGGHIPIAVVSANLVLPHVQSGRLRVLGISSAERMALLPDIPTFQEQGMHPFDISTWKALMGPAGLPLNVVKKITHDLTRIMDIPRVQEHLKNSGIEPLRGDATALTHLIQADAVKYRDIARSAQMQAY
ncbi:tripartite tricarboxylate transporter substrate binding protein [Hydrogenophaga sp. PAMC20947]|uniref:Bug family tripartite tricarboxylate transporter substrate binding protein n=1 Tax=Hydrogenophaga sp. PAMC20947 TaxID=2565558 RepID=UPI00109DCBA7|nr:tripartite tricarboxylate transporter substrate binding protein [Hydrogenophaga sp. PAMC20947]QCB46999.1 tripartite tricarboxylate transporter substrate binding protein [Hydrogenophaga sp. PAMC20947]